MEKAFLYMTCEQAPTSDLAYILGFAPSYGFALHLISADKLIIFLDSRYIGKKHEVQKSKIRKRLQSSKLQIQIKLLNVNSPKDLQEYLDQVDELFLSKNILYAWYDKIFTIFHGKIKMTNSLIAQYRMIKSEDEIHLIGKACQITDQVFDYIIDLSNTDDIYQLTEQQLRGKIISKMYELGAQAEAFETIVANGPNSAIPHHNFANKIIKPGVLLIDMGVKYEGYCSDFTRTIWIGPKNQDYNEFQKVYNIVQEAYNQAFGYAKSNMLLSDMDATARAYITKSGYGDNFQHSLGHGIGLDAHEKPSVSQTSQDILIPGMVFTIEPGIYLPNKRGIRLENTVYLSQDGIVSLSKKSM